mgnify:CR=1 FL=1
MKSFIFNYVAFNTWANKRIVDWLRSLPLEMLSAEVKSSYTSLDFTVQHILRTQRFWLHLLYRLNLLLQFRLRQILKTRMLFYIHLTDQKILLLLKKRVRIVHGLLNIRGIIWG